MATIIEKNPLMEAEEIINTINLFEPELTSAVASENGICAWFKTYISSDQFAALKPVDKETALEIYEGLKHVLDALMNYDIKTINGYLSTQALANMHKTK